MESYYSHLCIGVGVAALVKVLNARYYHGHISVTTNEINLKLHSCLQECQTVKLDNSCMYLVQIMFDFENVVKVLHASCLLSCTYLSNHSRDCFKTSYTYWISSNDLAGQSQNSTSDFNTIMPLFGLRKFSLKMFAFKLLSWIYLSNH